MKLLRKIYLTILFLIFFVSGSFGQTQYAVDDYDVQYSKNIEYKIATNNIDNTNLQQRLYRQKFLLWISFSIIIILLCTLCILCTIYYREKKHKKNRISKIEHSNKQLAIPNTIDVLENLKFSYPNKEIYFRKVNSNQYYELIKHSNSPLSNIEKQYILCFMAGLKSADIAEMFSIGHKSVYAVKYRIKKKFSTEEFPF